VRFIRQLTIVCVAARPCRSDNQICRRRRERPAATVAVTIVACVIINGKKPHERRSPVGYCVLKYEFQANELKQTEDY